MLSREQIAAKLADLNLILPKTDGGNVHLEEEREALETARQLGEWIEATAGESDGVPDCECPWCQGQRACKAWLRGEGESCPET
jgi:hypothetical protein